MRRITWSFRIAAAFAVTAVALFSSAAPTGDGNEFFEQKIRPILAEHCYKCHSHDAEKLKGGLMLDSRAGVLEGGDNGAVIVAGDPDRSRLITAVRYTDPELQMPPKDSKLSESQ